MVGADVHEDEFFDEEGEGDEVTLRAPWTGSDDTLIAPRGYALEEGGGSEGHHQLSFGDEANQELQGSPEPKIRDWRVNLFHALIFKKSPRTTPARIKVPRIKSHGI